MGREPEANGEAPSCVETSMIAIGPPYPIEARVGPKTKAHRPGRPTLARSQSLEPLPRLRSPTAPSAPAPLAKTE